MINVNLVELFNKEKLKTCIKLCWLLLFITWIFTLVTGKHIEIVVNNPKFIEICNFIDSSEILTLIVKYLMYTVQLTIVTYAMLNVKILSEHKLVVLVFISGIWLLKTIWHMLSITNYLDFMYIVLILIINKKRWLHSILGTLLVLVISFVSLHIKNISFDSEVLYSMPSLIMSVYSIDISYKLYLISALFECEMLCVDCYKHLLDSVFGLERIESFQGRTIEEFINCNPEGKFIIRVSGHLTACEDGKLIDTWDCRNEIVDIVWKCK